MDATNEQGSTALIAAAGQGHTTVVQQLLAAGASPMWQDRFGMLALHEAAGRGRLAATRLLLQAAPQAAHVYCEFGFSPVHMTVAQPAATGVLQSLLDAAPDTLLQTTEGQPKRSILHLAARMPNISVVQLLVECRPDMAGMPE